MKRRLARYATLAMVASVTACAGTYDVTVQDNPVQPQSIDDKAPPAALYDASLTFTGRLGEENHSDLRFRLDVAAFHDDAEKSDAAKLFPSHAAHLAAHPGGIPSVETVVTYAKQLDDTIYAGVEHAMQAGIDPTVASKRSILIESIAYLAQHRSADADTAIVHVEAALELGGSTIAPVPAELGGRVSEEKAAFLAKPLVSKPFGFYTWSDELRGIWAQDRLLQQPLASPGAACALAQAIAADGARKGRYIALVNLYGRLTNPVASSLVGLLPVAGTPSCAPAAVPAFLSESSSAEAALYDRLYPNGVSDGANLMVDLIAAIRNGTVDLTPKEGDGWYQYQEFALETLLDTDKSEERAKIAFMAHYKQRLIESFESLLTEHRETHAKQSGTEAVSAAVVPPVPDFRVEPLATVYVRHARSYVFLESALDAVMGPALLDKAVAVGANGVEKDTVRARVRRARDLYFGMYLVAMQDLGLAPKLGAKGDPERSAWSDLAKAADAWALGLAGDPIAAADVRVAVPIAGLGGGRARYWAVIGVRTTMAGYSFLHGDDTSAPKPEDQARVALPTEQFLEVTSSDTPLTREELRALCDKNQTVDAIKKAIEAR